VHLGHVKRVVRDDDLGHVEGAEAFADLRDLTEVDAPVLLKRFAEKKTATPSQIALSWLMGRKPFIVSIPGTRNVDHLNENLGALNVQLTPADLSELETAFSKLKVHGGRMNDMQMQVVDQTA
jgi:aryl-alcohol dehydrogenase-like predicted oxidoreductase